MMTLADLRARNSLPTWQEAVAIVQELLQATVGERASATRLPDLAHIGLNPDGTIALLPHSSIPENPVRHLAVLFGVLLEGVPAPAPLLDLAERNLKDPPEFGTADELSRALRYFERPGRDDDIRQLVSRAERAHEQKPVEEALRHIETRASELLEAKELPERHILERDGTVSIVRRERPPRLPAISTTEMAGAEPVPPRRPFDLHGTIRLLIAASALGFSGYWVFHSDAPREVGSVEEKVAGAAQKILGDGSDRGATTSAPPPGSPSANRAPASGPPPSPGAPGVSSGSASSSSVAPAPTGSSGSGSAGTPGGTGAPASGASAPGARSSAVEGRPSEGQDHGPTYSPVDADVTPPVPLSREAATPPPGVPAATYDLIVDPAGTVEQVRVIDGAVGMRESMMRSHIKSWKFRPATKNGQPVRYRMRVRVAL